MKLEKRTHKGFIVLTIYLIAGFFSLRAFAEERSFYLDAETLHELRYGKPHGEKPAATKAVVGKTVAAPPVSAPKFSAPQVAPAKLIAQKLRPQKLVISKPLPSKAETPHFEAATPKAEVPKERTEDEKIAQMNMDQKVGEQVAKLLSAQSSLQPETAAPEDKVLCAECSQNNAIKDAKYEQCSSENNYLDQRLEKMSEKSPLFKFLGEQHPELNQVIKPNCVQTFMNSKTKSKTAGGGIYRACTDDMNSTMGKAPRPCISERYVNTTANSFNLASSCLSNIPGFAKNLAAKLYPLESGFHVNAMNPMSHDAGSGIGQLTQVAILDVNRDMPKIKNVFANSKNSLCRSIESELLQANDPIQAAPKVSCQRLNVERGNPILNIIYSLNFLNILVKDLEKNTFHENRYASRFALGEHDMEKVKEALLTWAYNSGQSVRSPVKAVLDDYYRNEPVKDVDAFLARVKSALYGYKFYKYSHSGKIKNPAARAAINSQYYSNVNKSFDLVNRNLEGGQCLLNP